MLIINSYGSAHNYLYVGSFNKFYVENISRIFIIRYNVHVSGIKR